MNFIIELELQCTPVLIDPESDFEPEFEVSILAMKNFCGLFGGKLVDYSSALGEFSNTFRTMRNAFYTFKITREMKTTEMGLYTSALRAFIYFQGFKISKEELDVKP
jgi:hypothetical protein